ncbi:MAG: 50S ribosomal protein L23 [Muribaculaceae bacterium]|nr:50S ribosomal protein L23 [Muribaculaceae bacterium]
MEISIKPIVTEAATKLTDKLNRYTFRVSPDANKYQIKDLIEKLYGVKVAAVNTAVVRGKNKARYTKSGLLRGKTDKWKKAYITLEEGQTIDLYSNI